MRRGIQNKCHAYGDEDVTQGNLAELHPYVKDTIYLSDTRNRFFKASEGKFNLGNSVGPFLLMANRVNSRNKSRQSQPTPLLILKMHS